MTSSTKLEVHIVRTRRRRTKPGPQATCIENLVKFGLVVFKLYEQTNRHTHYSTMHPTQAKSTRYQKPCLHHSNTSSLTESRTGNVSHIFTFLANHVYSVCWYLFTLRVKTCQFTTKCKSNSHGSKTAKMKPSWHQKGKTRKVKPIWIYWSNRQ